MASRGRLEKGPKVETDWEDEYRKLRVDMVEQKKLTNEQESTIKNLNTQFSKMEREMVAMERAKFGSSSRPKSVSRDEENLVSKLTEQNHKLKSANQELTTKNKSLKESLDKRKREITAMKQRHELHLATAGTGAGVRSSTAPGRSKLNSAPLVEIRQGPTSRNGLAASMTTAANNSNIGDPAQNAKLLELSQKYKARAQAAEEQLRALRLSGAGSASTSALAKSGSASDDAQWKLQQLQQQYDYMVSKTSSQGVINRDAEEQLDEVNRRCRELRRALEDLRQEKELTDAKAGRASDLEEAVRDVAVSRRKGGGAELAAGDRPLVHSSTRSFIRSFVYL